VQLTLQKPLVYHVIRWNVGKRAILRAWQTLRERPLSNLLTTNGAEAIGLDAPATRDVSRCPPHTIDVLGAAMAKMHAVQVSQPNGSLELVERNIPAPSAGAVRIKVEACGVCHSDAFTKEGTFPGLQYPRVPGHEIAGILDAIGAGVGGWTTAQRVAVGWHGGHWLLRFLPARGLRDVPGRRPAPRDLI